jgi:hypothetical protein
MSKKRALYKDILISLLPFTHLCIHIQIQMAFKFKQCVNFNAFGFFWDTLYNTILTNISQTTTNNFKSNKLLNLF